MQPPQPRVRKKTKSRASRTQPPAASCTLYTRCHWNTPRQGRLKSQSCSADRCKRPRVTPQLERLTINKYCRKEKQMVVQDRRPTLIISRTLVPPDLTRLRSARIPSTISWWVSLGPVSVRGTINAAGTPRLLMMIFSPRATRSNNAEKCLLASNIPIDFIGLSKTTNFNRFPVFKAQRIKERGIPRRGSSE